MAGASTIRPPSAEGQARRRAAAAAAVGFIAIAAFQVALALGAPLSRASWGGASAHW